MAPHKTITVNGRVYDAVTGLPVEPAAAAKAPSTPQKKVAAPVAKPVAPRAAAAVKPAVKPVATPAPRAPRPVGTPRPDFVKTAKPAAVKPTAAKLAQKTPLTPRSHTTAGAVHSSAQRSQTLNRRAAKKPVPTNRPVIRRPTVGSQASIAKNSNVTRFAKHPAVQPAPAKPASAPVQAKKAATPDKPAIVHPIARRAVARGAAKKAPQSAAKAASAKEVKEQAIAKALAAPKPKPVKRKKDTKQRKRWFIIGGSVLVLLIALFAVYKLVPSISVSIASARAGIQATYPEYTPDGFALSQPVDAQDGEVSLKFMSNSNNNFYTITQTRSSWDSSAVLDNVVTPAAGADYVTTRERGLTIYTYESAAVWVNGGILYSIDSKAPLSGDQIRKIATSL